MCLVETLPVWFTAITDQRRNANDLIEALELAGITIEYKILQLKAKLEDAANLAAIQSACGAADDARDRSHAQMITSLQLSRYRALPLC